MLIEKKPGIDARFSVLAPEWPARCSVRLNTWRMEVVVFSELVEIIQKRLLRIRSSFFVLMPRTTPIQRDEQVFLHRYLQLDMADAVG
jgi:hypothetical protein